MLWVVVIITLIISVAAQARSRIKARHGNSVRLLVFDVTAPRLPKLVDGLEHKYTPFSMTPWGITFEHSGNELAIGSRFIFSSLPLDGTKMESPVDIGTEEDMHAKFQGKKVVIQNGKYICVTSPGARSRYYLGRNQDGQVFFEMKKSLAHLNSEENEAHGKYFEWIIDMGSVLGGDICLYTRIGIPHDDSYSRFSEAFLDDKIHIDPYGGVLAASTPRSSKNRSRKDGNVITIKTILDINCNTAKLLLRNYESEYPTELDTWVGLSIDSMNVFPIRELVSGDSLSKYQLVFVESNPGDFALALHYLTIKELPPSEDKYLPYRGKVFFSAFPRPCLSINEDISLSKEVIAGSTGLILTNGYYIDSYGELSGMEIDSLNVNLYSDEKTVITEITRDAHDNWIFKTRAGGDFVLVEKSINGQTSYLALENEANVDHDAPAIEKKIKKKLRSLSGSKGKGMEHKKGRDGDHECRLM